MSLLTKWVRNAVIVTAVGFGTYTAANYFSNGRLGQTMAAVKEETGGIVSRLQSDKLNAQSLASQYRAELDNIAGRPYVVVEQSSGNYFLAENSGQRFSINEHKGFPVLDVPLEVKLDEIYARHSEQDIRQANVVIQKERELEAARVAARATLEKGAE
ncbi:hypothetical protein HY483_02805 [Candidatus Woesearchaeota archaeon]|nr:hypothetical protein [Candidatus Woesearchaeota archaeon]